MNGTLKARDTINGALGTAYAIINGNREPLLYLQDIEANIEKSKREIKVLGNAGTKHKASGWNGTGAMNIYYSTSLFRKLMVEYMKTGKDTYFDILIENYDPSSEIGRQSVMLKNVNLDTSSITKLDINSTELSESIGFTFEGVELLESFTEPIGE